MTSLNCSSYTSLDKDCKLIRKRNWLNVEDKIDWEPTIPEDSSDFIESGCKTLWFSGVYEKGESFCMDEEVHHSYLSDYAIAMNSANHNTGDVLQPIAMLGRFGTLMENSTTNTKFGNWIESKGGKIVYVPRLSFHDDLADRPDFIKSAFMRLDVPLFIKQHKLFDLPGICQKYVLYTDSDVIFSNPLLESDLVMLKKRLAKSEHAILSYGRESTMNPMSSNTGVMMIDVKKFEEELPKILDHGRKMKTYPSHDQELLNLYFFGKVEGGLDKRIDLLPLGYNWKPYWGLNDPSEFKNVKIIHTHGPKRRRGLEEIAYCNLDENVFGNEIGKVPFPYKPHVENGICFGHGALGRWTLKALEFFRAPVDWCPRRRREFERKKKSSR